MWSLNFLKHWLPVLSKLVKNFTRNENSKNIICWLSSWVINFKYLPLMFPDLILSKEKLKERNVLIQSECLSNQSAVQNLRTRS